MQTDRRSFLRGSAIAGAVGIATIPTLTQADNMPNWLCVVVDSVDELTKDLKSASDTVIVKDITRGGVFIYDKDKSDINNGGTVFNGWVRQGDDNILNVHWFGAVGDGVADDTQALQQAIFESTGWNGHKYNIDNKTPKTVYIPRGYIGLLTHLELHKCNI